MADKETRPLFRFSRNIVYRAILAPSFLVVAVILLLEMGRLGPVGIPLAEFSFWISIISAVSLLEFFRSIREARFYEDHFTVVGWKVNRRMNYGDVETVVRHMSKSGLSSYPTVRIFVRGDDAPLVIPSIPKNRKLKTDLYSWLRVKLQAEHKASSDIKYSQEAEPLSSADILCIVSSSSLMLRGEIYAIVITKTRIIGSSKSGWAPGYSVYLGHGSQTDEAEREKAYEIAQGIMKNNDLLLRRESILQIGYQAPGSMSVGYLVFRTADGDVQLNLAPIASDPGFREVLACLLRGVTEFAPGIIRDEKSGDLLTSLNL